MTKVKVCSPGRFRFHCPGCDTAHVVSSAWSFNGDFDKPTFSPSVLCTMDLAGVTEEKKKEYGLTDRCHSFVRDGRIEFLSDCSHALAGQTVELPDIDQ